MGFIILCAIITIVCAIVFYIYCKIPFASKIGDFKEVLGMTSVIGIISFGLILLISIAVAAIQNAGYNGFVARNQAIYDSLVYQLENDLYDNDNDLGKKELYNQIQEWNKDLSEGKAMTHDPWLGIFWIDAYDEFDFIELK